MEAKLIGLALQNTEWLQFASYISKKYFDNINLLKCESFKGQMYEPDPHITLLYDEDCVKGPNYLYWAATCHCRDIYGEIKNKDLILKNAVLDTFDNDDARVLKINILKSNCNISDLLLEWNYEITKLLSPLSEPKEFNPHITLTYLNPNTPDSIILEIKNEFKTPDLIFKITDIMIGGGENCGYESIKLKII